MAWGPSFVRGRVVEDGGDDGVCVLEFPASNWGSDVSLLMSALVAGEGSETRAFSACRLVGLSLPPGLLPGPAVGPVSGRRVGVIVKPSLGLSPAEVGAVAGAAALGGAWLVKDDELLGDPPWCPLEDRVRAVVSALPPGVVYCPNVTGPSSSLVSRAERAVSLGAGGVMVNAFAQGLDSVLALRSASLGVPILAHRVGAGAMVRNPSFGVSGQVLVSLLRWCGADLVLVGAFGGKLFDSDADVRSQLAAARDPLESVLGCTAMLGGGVGPSNARAQADLAGGDGLVLLLGSAAYAEGSLAGLTAAVRRAVEALAA